MTAGPVGASPRAARAPSGGLTAEEAARRLAARGPVAAMATSRSYASIVRANLLTIFNLILAAFGTLTLVLGDWRDALFLLVLVANAAIGIGQEVRAKHSLDRLALLVAPRATVIRDGRAAALAPDELVVGDLVRVQAGDQLVADGVVTDSAGLMLDEAILTGEAEPVARGAGPPCARGRSPSRARARWR